MLFKPILERIYNFFWAVNSDLSDFPEKGSSESIVKI